MQAYRRLLEELGKPKTGVCSNIVFYLALKPEDFSAAVDNLAAVGLNRPRGLHRIVVEKPFGSDLQGAQALNELLHRHYDEQQIYRIDHYLAKETVQNLLVFRFANTLIEPVWNRNFIDHVQITVGERAGIETRADYYDKSGALRDMVQNHIMQLLTLVAMEPPAALEANALRDEKVKVLRSIRPIPLDEVPASVVRAQYAAASVEGKPVPGYLGEPGVEKNSSTETYVAARFYIDNWRWRGVPFYLRTGKRLAEQQSFIAIRMRHPPQQLFRETALANMTPNWILLSLQPDEGMHMEIHAKRPGLGMQTRVIRMEAGYRGRSRARRRCVRGVAGRHHSRRCDQLHPFRRSGMGVACRRSDPAVVGSQPRSPAHLSRGKLGPRGGAGAVCRRRPDVARPGVTIRPNRLRHPSNALPISCRTDFQIPSAQWIVRRGTKQSPGCDRLQICALQSEPSGTTCWKASGAAHRSCGACERAILIALLVRTLAARRVPSIYSSHLGAQFRARQPFQRQIG